MLLIFVKVEIAAKQRIKGKADTASAMNWKTILEGLSLRHTILIMEYIAERITISDAICNGRPTIRGSRISVQTILDFLSAGDSSKDILDQYPSLEPEDIKACIKFAADLMGRNFSIKTVA